MNKLSKLADFYREEYVRARSIRLMKPKRLTSTGKHSLFKQVYRAATLEKEGKGERTVSYRIKDVEIIPNKEGAAPPSRLSK